ncbi:epimerase [Dokdonia pacifica]|uniref:Nucleoside-diphosphate-sugar epimerase n=1 Tax=Dokdonia pacifica TaxID=1627892 RepID=A0A238W9N4_9FLAO|nr:NAD(P)H-binding protein [Dokdonia pacifica]GGG13822.1 epimerase [Dokdonia pacifica]SNR43208.1 Nucleoside-diphosphate-sugar epimerase [Dokdonia pacifica]
MNKKITIAGLGWLGNAFASTLLSLGYTVKGSVTDTAKAQEMTRRGVAAYPIVLTETGVTGKIDTLLSDTDVLAIMIPPGLRRNTGANYALKMAHFLHEIENAAIKKVILISSTSVYDDAQGEVTEKDIPKPQSNAAKQLYDVEQIFFNTSAFETTIVRFGGLFGGSRNPVRFLAGRKGLSNGNAPVNMIHREDCIGILLSIIQKNAFGHIFNAVAPQHPTKREYYTAQAEKLDLTAPQYDEEGDVVFKKVDSTSVYDVLGYEFKVAL